MARAQARAARYSKTPSPPQDRASVRGEELTGMKLYAAQEILAEVFGISLTEAEEMIKQRSRERTLWPESFSADDIGL
ncbi:MAG TPA: hypothetical protein PKY20_05000 [Methanothrix sp.]|jgi:hypothetical protein|nr:hypothetical protein [Methanothrix sp.]HQE97541.1 hypothetical protein [Methanothrix sp.]HUM81271.1 hypothetical protein [Methanothrix sp.]